VKDPIVRPVHTLAKSNPTRMITVVPTATATERARASSELNDAPS
jgi:hypothetical protein